MQLYSPDINTYTNKRLIDKLFKRDIREEKTSTIIDYFRDIDGEYITLDNINAIIENSNLSLTEKEIFYINFVLLN